MCVICTFIFRYYDWIGDWNCIFILSLSRKDVRLPVQLQRAMAAEAEAAREARAKVVNTTMTQKMD